MGFKDIVIVLSKEEADILKTIDRKRLIKLENDREGIFIDSFISLVEEGYFREQGSLHEILQRSELHWYSTPHEPRNPELEARITKLKAEQANKEYRNMTKNLYPNDKQSISFQEDVRSVSSQVTALINFALSVGGSFFFAYKAVEYALPEQNIPAQVMMGIVTSTIVALADLYFLARTI